MLRWKFGLSALMFLALCFGLMLGTASCGDDDDDASNDDQSDDDSSDDDLADDDATDDDTSPPPPTLLVGSSRYEITPDYAVILGGYGMYFLSDIFCRWSTGVHDPLYATAIAIEDKNQETIIELVLDSIGLLENDVHRIQQTLSAATGVSTDHIFLSATHSHGTPDTVGIYGVMLPPITGRDDRFIEQMIDGAYQAGIEAFRNRRPAVMRVNQGVEPHFHFNHMGLNDPNATIDDAITVVGFYETDGDVIGTITNWGCHPTVMPAENTLITADFVGAFYAAMDLTIGGVNMFINGNEGASVRPANTYHPFQVNPEEGWGDWDDVNRVGTGLATTAMNLLGAGEVIDDPTLSVVSAQFEGLMQNPLLGIMNTLGLIAHEFPAPGELYPEPIAFWRLGPLTAASAPGEVVPTIGLQLREIMDGRYKMVLNLTQDWIGYFLTPEQFRSLRYIDYSFVCAGPEVGQALVEGYQQMFGAGE